MGILIASTVAHSSVKPKRVRISEDETLNWGTTGTTGANNINNASELVRRNAIRGRWLRRRYPHNPSPAEPNNAERTTGMVPPGLSTDYSDLEGMSLPELEERADELRRTLGLRHNIHVDLPPGMGDWPGAQHEEEDVSRNDVVDRVRQHSNELLEDQRTQSLMFEIRRRIGQTGRRRVRAFRSRNVRVPAVGTTTQQQQEPEQEQMQHHYHEPREPLPLQQLERTSSPTSQPYERTNNIDEYDALIQETEPSQGWRQRALRIHRGALAGESGATRRERNRHAFVTSMVEDDESSLSENEDGEPIELPFDFGMD